MPPTLFHFPTFSRFPLSSSNIKSHDSFGLDYILVELRDNYHLDGLSCSCLTLKVLSGNHLLLLIFNLDLASFLPKPRLPCPTLTSVMQSQVSSSQHHTSNSLHRKFKANNGAFLNRNRISSHIGPIFLSPCDIILQINCNAVILLSHKPSLILWFFCYSTSQMNLLYVRDVVFLSFEVELCFSFIPPFVFSVHLIEGTRTHWAQ